MLTRKQYELLVYIDRHLKQTGFSPSFEEMKEALQLKSKSGIHRLISALEERGYLGRRHHRARALEVLKLPDNLIARPEADVPDDEAAAGFSPNVIRGDFTSRLPGVRAADDAVAVQLPLYGRIAAGLPIEAGILDGDTVIINKGESAENGQIVVALVDENEVTLKRLRRRGNSIALEPCNARHETRILFCL